MRITKRTAAILGIGMLAICMLAGCGSKDSGTKTGTDGAQTGQQSQKAGAEDAGYVFEANGVELAVDMDASDIEDKLGEPESYFEQPSCAAQGIAKIYSYAGFEIETYPDGDKDLIASIIFKDDSVATPEGIDLSMTRDDIVDAYGSDFEETETGMVYEKGGTKLCFVMDGDDIASIEYDSPVLN